ncbi:MAG: VWA domain-containing protein [Bacteroidaceae bacterium]|nr:VWA domain-containing protein [Bacteroidaceae bacterium]
MLRFASPEYLYALILPLAVVLLYIFSLWLHNRRMKKFGNPRMLWALVLNYSSARQHVKFILMCLALVLLVVALARPQWGTKKENIKRNGIEVVFSLDVSNSMLANDVSPNRLERSKMLISSLVERMHNDKVGLNIFAGEAYPQLPITNDIVSVKMFLDAITTGMVTLQGTSVASAIELAKNSFTKNEKVGKAIIIVTDGEDHEEGALDAAKSASEAGMRVFILGVGSAEGSTILTRNGFLTDNEGRYVRTALNEVACREIAEAGQGIYIHVDNTQAAQQQLASEIEKMQKDDSESSFTVYNEQFVAVALIAFILLLVEFLLLDTVLPFYRKANFFS